MIRFLHGRLDPVGKQQHVNILRWFRFRPWGSGCYSASADRRGYPIFYAHQFPCIPVSDEELVERFDQQEIPGFVDHQIVVEDRSGVVMDTLIRFRASGMPRSCAIDNRTPPMTVGLDLSALRLYGGVAYHRGVRHRHSARPLRQSRALVSGEFRPRPRLSATREGWHDERRS